MPWWQNITVFRNAVGSYGISEADIEGGSPECKSIPLLFFPDLPGRSPALRWNRSSGPMRQTWLIRGHCKSSSVRLLFGKLRTHRSCMANSAPIGTLRSRCGQHVQRLSYGSGSICAIVACKQPGPVRGGRRTKLVAGAGGLCKSSISFSVLGAGNNGHRASPSFETDLHLRPTC